MPRNGPWIQTYSGNQFWPLDPRPGDFKIKDIAHALSNLCRFAGHVDMFYSVAEHCVTVAELLPPTYQLEGLMHDAAEAYIVDLPRPIKQELPEYKAIETKIERAMADQFDLVYPWPEEVKHADNQALRIEQLQLMKAPPIPWTTQGINVPKWELAVMNPNGAKELYWFWFNRLIEQRRAA